MPIGLYPTDGYVWNEMPRDTAKWFRPSDVAVGPDGAVYIADWYDPVVGGHQMHDRSGYGRIYRITPKDRNLPLRAPDLETTAGQIDALLSPAPNVRVLGFDALTSRGSAVADDVAALLNAENPYHRGRALWVLSRLGADGTAVVREHLGAEDPRLRMAAFRALRQVEGEEEWLEAAAGLARDPSPGVRREVAIALRDVPFERSGPLLLSIAEGYDGSDRWYLEAFGIGSTGNENDVFAMLSEAFNPGEPPLWDERFADLAWRLHPATAVAHFERRAGASNVSPSERRRAVVALAFIDDRSAAQAMANLTRSELPDVAEQAAWWMQHRTMNDWHKYDVDGWMRIAAEARHESLQELVPKKAVLLDPNTRIDHRIAAAQALARSIEGGRMLLDLAIRGLLPYQVRESIGAEMFTKPDLSVRSLASRFFPHPGGEASYEVENITAVHADAERGRGVFYASCASCHRAGAVGGDAGPDLTAIGRKFDRSALVDAIVHPDASIAFGYESSLLRLTDGRVIVGRPMSSGKLIDVRDADGRRHVVEHAEVESMQRLDISPMPEPHQLGLSEQDVADVAAFLSMVLSDR